MRIYSVNTAMGLGDIICTKAILDEYRDCFDQINVGFKIDLLKEFKKGIEKQYLDFVINFANLIYKDDPLYNLTPTAKYRYLYVDDIMYDLQKQYGARVKKPNYSKQLCNGDPLNIGEYIVLNTKVRFVDKTTTYKQIYNEFWDIMNKISQKYKVVIMGEKVIEKSIEYSFPHYQNCIFSLYEDAIKNIDNKLDITVPALGITIPDINHIQQDCLIMNQAKACVNVGVGGSFCLAMATGNMIALRAETDIPVIIADHFFEGQSYSDAFVTKDINAYLNELKKYI